MTHLAHLEPLNMAFCIMFVSRINPSVETPLTTNGFDQHNIQLCVGGGGVFSGAMLQWLRLCFLFMQLFSAMT